MSVCALLSPKGRGTAEMQSRPNSIAEGQVQCMLLLLSSLLPTGAVLCSERSCRKTDSLPKHHIMEKNPFPILFAFSLLNA